MTDSNHAWECDAVAMRDVQGLLRKERPEELAQWLAGRLPTVAAEQIPDLSRGLAGRMESATEREAVAALLSGPLETPDDLERLAQQLDRLGLELAALAAFRATAALESLDPALLEVWDGPFNGQSVRQSLFEDLVRALGVAAIVETGTFRGSSTVFMAKRSGLPLFSCEANPRYFHYSARRLADLPNVTLNRQDSRAFLKQLLDSATLPPGPALFYLDAHWHDDLPVWEEIDIILSRGVPAVIVIDDFRVPGDLGFSYDDYGVDRCLSVQDLRRNVASEAEWFFPRGSSASESGKRRGCAVLARGEQAERIIRDVPALDRLDWRTAVQLDAVTAEIPALRTANAQLRADIEQLRTEAEGLRAAEAAARADAELRELRLRADIASRELELRMDAERRELGLRADLARQELRSRALENGVVERDRKIAELERDAARQREVFAALLEENRQRSLEFERRVRELQSSRWRRIGLRLRLAKRATFEG